MLITTNENSQPKFALIIIEAPAFDDPHQTEYTVSQWQQFLRESCLEIAPYKGLIKYAENVFLLPLENSISNLIKILAPSIQVSRPYKVLFFEKEPNWITSNKVEGENQ